MTGATFGVIAVGIIGAVVIAIGLIVGATDRSSGGGTGGGGSGGGPPGGYAPDLEFAWSVRAADLTGDHGTFHSVDGTVPGSIIETSIGWVVMTEASTLAATLVSVDPTSGDAQWSLPMPEARCTATPEDTIVCLTRDGGSTFDLVTVDAATGTPVGDPVPTGVAHVPVLVVPMGEDGFVTLTMRADLIGLDPQGDTLWTEAIEMGDYEPEWLEPDVATIGSSAILFLDMYVGTAEATAAGVTLHECRSVAVTPEAWMCTGEDEAIGWGPDGEELWRDAWRDYYLVDQYQRIAPVIIVDNWDGSVSGVDPLTGKHGPAVEISDDRGSSFNFLGDPDLPFVFAEDTVSLLDADLTTVLWTASIEDAYLSIVGGGVIGDSLLVDGQHSYAFDITTGDMLWERSFLPFDSFVVGDAFVGMRVTELIRYELP